MRLLFALILLPFFACAQSQNTDILGLWVKAKVGYKDGSRMVNRQNNGMDFLKYDFRADGTVDRSNDVLFSEYKIPYAINGNMLKIGGQDFTIGKLSHDTLELYQMFMGAEDSQIPVYYFVKPDLVNITDKPVFNAAIKDSVYQATNILFPQCDGRMFAYMAQVATRFEKGTVKISFIVDKKGRVKNCVVLDKDSTSTGFSKTLANAFSNYQLKWFPAKKNNVPVSTLVQIDLKCDHKSEGGYGGTNWMSIQYPFLPKYTSGKPISDGEIILVRQSFSDAITEVNRRNYQKALELLNYCIEKDDIDISAYYLRAMVNISLGNKKEACKDWETLAGLGQVKAATELGKFCTN